VAAGTTAELLVLDAMGVVFESGHIVRDHLVPVAQAHGSPLTPEAIRERYVRGSLGQLGVERLWRELGVRDAAAANEAYLSLHRLMPGSLDFLRWAHGTGVRVACLTNDVAAWSLALRERHGLAALVDPWVVSSQVGSRKPDRAIFEALRRASGAPFGRWVVVDDAPANVDAARALGAEAHVFGPAVDGGAGVADFDDMARLVARRFGC
jgi:putative hydrolase of the HAD superfamily